MATIRARKLADGTVSYTAQIRIKRDGVQVYQESQTFARKQAAQAWVRKRETELDAAAAGLGDERLLVEFAKVLLAHLSSEMRASPKIR